jgi:hypothetical protein
MMRWLALAVMFVYACVPMHPRGTTPDTTPRVIYTLAPGEPQDDDVIFEDLREEAWRVALTRAERRDYDVEMRCNPDHFRWDAHEGDETRWNGRYEL